MQSPPALKSNEERVGANPKGSVSEVVAVSATRERREPTPRLANVERLRIIAMLEIVVFHVGGAIGSGAQRLPIIGGLGLPIFLLLNNAFNTTLSERMGTRAFLDVKVTRLVLPWLMWCGIYGVVVFAEKVRHHEALSDNLFSPWVLVGGTYTHLWFVPFALFGSVLIAAAMARTQGRSHRAMAGLALGIGAVIVVVDASVLHSGTVQWPVVQWLFALPSPLLGFALGRVLMSHERPLLEKLTALLVLAALLVLVLSWLGTVPEMTVRYAVSMALVSLLFLWPGTADALSRRLTPLLFGVYLTHPLLVRAYQSAHLPQLPVPLLGVVIFVVSALLVEALRRSPLRRLV